MMTNCDSPSAICCRHHLQNDARKLPQKFRLFDNDWLAVVDAIRRNAQNVVEKLLPVQLRANKRIDSYLYSVNSLQNRKKWKYQCPMSQSSKFSNNTAYKITVG